MVVRGTVRGKCFRGRDPGASEPRGCLRQRGGDESTENSRATGADHPVDIDFMEHEAVSWLP